MKDLTSLKRIIALFTAFILIFSFSSCDGNVNESTTSPSEPETQQEIPGGSLSVPYTSSDYLSPYYCSTVLNSSLSSLVFRSLYRLNTSFSPVKDLASSENVSGLLLNVHIIPDLVFSDGSVLSADDVVYSFECAKKSKQYSSALSGISSCKKDDDLTVVFELKENDVNILNALIFPIVKKGTADSETNLPIGNGFYQYSQDGIRLSLKANLRYAGALPAIGTVRLTDVKNNTSPENLVVTNEIDFCYDDLADANITNVNTSSMGVYLNNLVFMGVNHSNVNLVLPSFRRALSLAVDRQSVAENSFRGYARAAAVPFNTSWSEYSSSLSASEISFSASPDKAQELLAERGFGKDGISMDLTLICSENNTFIRNTASFIASELQKINVNASVQFLSPENLKKRVEAGEYDLYIAEIKLPATMDLSAFFSPSGAASYGISLENCISDDEYFRYKNGEITLDDFIKVFNEEMPFIPLVYRNARFLYTRKITSPLSVTESFLFSDMYNWTFTR